MKNEIFEGRGSHSLLESIVAEIVTIGLCVCFLTLMFALAF